MVAEHVHNVISSCALALHALKSFASTRHGRCLITDDLLIGYHRQADLRLQCLPGVHQCNWLTMAWSIHPTKWLKRFHSSQFADLRRVVLGSWREVIWDRYARQYSRST